jgi:hypothetical protein
MCSSILFRKVTLAAILQKVYAKAVPIIVKGGPVGRRGTVGQVHSQHSKIFSISFKSRSSKTRRMSFQTSTIADERVCASGVDNGDFAASGAS